MLLTAKGKYLHDLFAYRVPGAQCAALPANGSSSSSSSSSSPAARVVESSSAAFSCLATPIWTQRGGCLPMNVQQYVCLHSHSACQALLVISRPRQCRCCCTHACTLTAAAAAAGDTPELLLDVDAAGLHSALQWLGKYKLRRKLQLADARQQYSVWTAFDGQLQAGGAGEAAAAAVRVCLLAWVLACLLACVRACMRVCLLALNI
jgi:hypothetical protein